MSDKTERTIPNKDEFLNTLNSLMPSWNLAHVRDMQGQMIYALAIKVQGPLMIGDEMSINDSIIPIDDHPNAFYGFCFGARTADLPDDPEELKKIWKKSEETYIFIQDTLTKNGRDRDYCPACKTKHGFSTGMIENSQICPECFGLGHIYHFGPQKELGTRLLSGIQTGRESGMFWAKFEPDSLAALLEMYDRYSTGVLCEIAQGYLVERAWDIIQHTFPNAFITCTIDDIREPGLGDYVSTKAGSQNRHFYFPCNDGTWINLHTGEQEIPSEAPRLVGKSDLPTKNRWNVTLDILRNLCKLTK